MPYIFAESAFEHLFTTHFSFYFSAMVRVYNWSAQRLDVICVAS